MPSGPGRGVSRESLDQPVGEGPAELGLETRRRPAALRAQTVDGREVAQEAQVAPALCGRRVHHHEVMAAALVVGGSGSLGEDRRDRGSDCTMRAAADAALMPLSIGSERVEP